MKLDEQISLIESTSIGQAKFIQNELAQKVRLIDQFGEIKTVAGLDVGFKENNHIALGGIVVLSFPDFEVIEQQTSQREVVFPYVPGFLSFREVPVLLDAVNKLRHKPDLLICDGQGIAHPRRFGLACHLGIALDMPAIGAAKSRLIGQFREPAVSKGSSSHLVDKGERIGTVMRSRQNTKPLFVSPGHKISFESANKWVLNCCPKFRIPETTRHAHKLVST